MMIDRCIHLAYFDPAKGHVPNPGMGIHAYAFSDHMHYGFTSGQFGRSENEAPNRKLDKATFDRLLELPFADNLYFRTDWCNIQKEKGKLFIQEELEWLLDGVRSRGRRWSLRIMNSSRHSVANNSVPEFLQGKLPMLAYKNDTSGHGTSYYPAYTDDYLGYWRELLDLLGDKFDGDPLLEFVDISGYGIWGEGHHYGMHENDKVDSNRHAPNAEEVITRLVEDHENAFRKTPLAMTLHYLDYQTGVDTMQNTDVWLRRDSWQRFSSKFEYAAVTTPRPGRAILWETIIPEVPECAPPMFSRERLVQRYLDWGAHYIAMGFNPWEAIFAHQYNTDLYEMIASKVGYRIRPSIVMRRINERDEHELLIALANDGNVPPPGRITLTAKFPSGREVSIDLPVGAPTVNDKTLYSISMPKEDFGATSDRDVQLILTIAIKGKKHPVRWAVKQVMHDPFTITAPLITPPAGDPFLTPSGVYDPVL